jgi:hypothetical protein
MIISEEVFFFCQELLWQYNTKEQNKLYIENFDQEW